MAHTNETWHTQLSHDTHEQVVANVSHKNEAFIKCVSEYGQLGKAFARLRRGGSKVDYYKYPVQESRSNLPLCLIEGVY